MKLIDFAAITRKQILLDVDVEAVGFQAGLCSERAKDCDGGRG
jgi:hypothetical protein